MSLISTPLLALTVSLIFFLVHFPYGLNVWTKITKSTGGFTVSNRLALSLWGCAPRRSSFPYKSGTTMSSSYRAILCTLQTLTDHPRTCPLFHGTHFLLPQTRDVSISVLGAIIQLIINAISYQSLILRVYSSFPYSSLQYTEYNIFTPSINCTEFSNNIIQGLHLIVPPRNHGSCGGNGSAGVYI